MKFILVRLDAQNLASLAQRIINLSKQFIIR